MLIFTNKTQQPSQAEVEKALGNKLILFNTILRESQVKETAWKYYSKSSGWTLQCKRVDRNLLFIKITDSGFYVWFTLGKQAKSKAVEMVTNKLLKQEIGAAREYKEGTSFKVDVATTADLADIAILVDLKQEIVKS